jgi:hypothetical protein
MFLGMSFSTRRSCMMKNARDKNHVTLFLYRDRDMTLKRALSDVFDGSRLVRRWSASFLTLYSIIILTYKSELPNTKTF